MATVRTNGQRLVDVVWKDGMGINIVLEQPFSIAVQVVRRDRRQDRNRGSVQHGLLLLFVQSRSRRLCRSCCPSVENPWQRSVGELLDVAEGTDVDV